MNRCCPVFRLVLGALLLALAGCASEPLTNPLAADVPDVQPQAGLATAGGDPVRHVAAQAEGNVAGVPEARTREPGYDPHGHHVGGPPPRRLAACRSVPFGAGGPAHLLRSGAQPASAHYAMRSVALVPARPGAAQSASYALTNIQLRELQTCPER